MSCWNNENPYWSIWPNDQLDKLNILISQLEVNLCCNRSRIKSNIQVPTTQVAIGVHQLGTTYMLPHHLVATVPVFKIYHLPGYKQCPGRTQTMDSFLHNWKFCSLFENHYFQYSGICCSIFYNNHWVTAWKRHTAESSTTTDRLRFFTSGHFLEFSCTNFLRHSDIFYHFIVTITNLHAASKYFLDFVKYFCAVQET